MNGRAALAPGAVRQAAHGTAPVTAGAKTTGWAASLAIVAGLAAIVGARWLGTRQGFDALVLGAAFGVALAAVWVGASGGVAAAARAGRSLPRSRKSVTIAVASGLAVGIGLVGVAVVGSGLGGVTIPAGSARPAAPFAAWAAITIVVATAEEGILRGALFDRLQAAGGTLVALAITTLAFALLHVPLYGWAVVPLDLAVGLALGGLRISTRTVLAPAVAHTVADLATWWL